MSNVEKEYEWKVRVSCMTYNQASYIEDAMNGFCMQETDFPFVCTIVDDASTDGEQEVIKKYLEEHFDLEDKSIVRNEETENYTLTFARHKTNTNCYFAVLYLKYNHYSIKKDKMPYIAEWHENCKYIAYCEGDDYWIDSEKLQKQVDYLDNHPQVSYVFTARYIKDEIHKTIKEQTYKLRIYTMKDILSNFNPGLQSVCFRKEVLAPPIAIAGINGDRLYPYKASLIGELHCINRITSVYRRTGKGISTRISSDEWFEYAVRDFYMFHSILGIKDKKSYLVGTSQYIGSFFYNKRIGLSSFENWFEAIKRINPTITRKDLLIMIFYKIGRQIQRWLGDADVKIKILS